MSNTNFFSDENQINASKQNDVVIPIIEETAVIGKKILETATIKVSKQVTETNETVNVNLLSDDYMVEHVAINKYADNDEPPTVRNEGNTLVVPVIKEVLVKRLLVVEEIRITKKSVERNEQHNVLLRKENITVERVQTEAK